MSEIQYTPTMYEQIMKNSPTMRAIVEGKIAEEVAKKQVEIDQLKADKISLAQNVLDLTTIVEAMLQGGIA